MALGALLFVTLALCWQPQAGAFVVPAVSRSPARASSSVSSAPAAARAAAPGGPLWLRAGTGSGSKSRMYARISEKPGDKADREQGGEQGLPFLGGGDGEEVPTLTRQQEEVGGWVGVCGCVGVGVGGCVVRGNKYASYPLSDHPNPTHPPHQAIDASMGVVPPEQEELTGEAWTAEVERRLQEMYEKGTYDPTPINLTPQELSRQQWVDDFLNKEERPIRWDLGYWFGTWTRGDIKYSSPGRGLKSFGFALVGIGLVTLLFLIEDEFVNPVFADYQKWDGNDIFHFGGDLGAWAASVPGRASNYITHFDWREWSTRVAARAGAAPRWYQQIIGLPGDNQLGGPGP